MNHVFDDPDGLTVALIRDAQSDVEAWAWLAQLIEIHNLPEVGRG